MNNFMTFSNLLYDERLKNITSKRVEAMCIKHRLNFPQVRDNEVENRRFTPFVYTFYDLLLNRNGLVPFQSEFVDAYINKYKSDERLIRIKEDVVRARLMRCFPSYVRDFHFALKMKESGLFDDVVYNIEMDVTTGIDLMVMYDSTMYAVHLFVETARGNQWRSKKDNRHDENPHVRNIDLTVNREDGFTCGKYFLFGDKQVEILYGLIKEDSEGTGLQSKLDSEGANT